MSQLELGIEAEFWSSEDQGDFGMEKMDKCVTYCGL
jgi:hypothetical protein